MNAVQNPLSIVRSPILVILLALALPSLGTADLHAQERVVDSAALEAAVLGHESATEADRSSLRDLLADPEVREFMRDRGVDPERADRAVETLDAEELEGVAALVEKVKASMQTRATITISAGALLLVLLLVLLLA